MPHITTSSGGRLFYRWDGPEQAPVLVLSNSLGTRHGMWDDQIPELARHFRVLRYDSRGHGDSDVTPGPYSIELLARDVLDLLDALGLEKASYCGLSLGGMVGMWLGANAPRRVDRLVLCNTSACTGGVDQWNARIEAVRKSGMSAVADAVVERWFTAGFRQTVPESVHRIRQMLLETSPEGYVAACAAVRDMDQRETLRRISAPTLVICGTRDPATPPDHARLIAERIARSSLIELDAAHLSNIEQAGRFTPTVLGFLLFKDFDGGDRARYEAGMAKRRAVLGDAHVDRAQRNTNEFNRDFQELITRYAWGEIWSRPGLDQHTRRLLTLAMLIPLNRPDEFQMHVRAALGDGVTREELKELILHSALYCGLPAANVAFHLAEQVMAVRAEGK